MKKNQKEVVYVAKTRLRRELKKYMRQYFDKTIKVTNSGEVQWVIDDPASMVDIMMHLERQPKVTQSEPDEDDLIIEVR